MEKLFLFILGLIIGIILSAVALAIKLNNNKNELIWMDENYELHPIKKRKK